MSDHTEWGHASEALYTLHPRERAAEELRAENADEITCPYVVGLWNQTGDGLALQGTRRELLTYLRLVIEHVERETEPRGELDQSAAPRLRPATTPQSRASTSKRSASSTTSPTPPRSSTTSCKHTHRGPVTSCPRRWPGPPFFFRDLRARLAARWPPGGGRDP